MKDVELKGFPPSTHQYPYQGRDDFLAILDYERSLPYSKHETFLVTNINKKTFKRDFHYSDDTLFSRSWKEYLSHLNILLIKIHSGPTNGRRSHYKCSSLLLR
jgi:hypothetical protein